MSNYINVTVTGDAELEAKIKNVVTSISPDLIEPILMEGAEQLKSYGQPLTPYNPNRKIFRGKYGHLRDAWVVKKMTRGKNPAPALVAMSMAAAPHMHLVENGTKPRYTSLISKRTGRVQLGRSAYRGIMPAKPFFKPAWTTYGPVIKEGIVSRILSQIETAAQT